jgi:glycosyltransferase involved in cell wall biosynthesis
MRILLVAYFYPPCTDTGAERPRAMAKYLRQLGHDVTVLTTAAYGSAEGETSVVRTADAQRWRARMRGHDHVGSLFDSDTYSGRPHFLSRVVVPEPLALAWAPFARRAARRLNAAQPFDCVITTSPPESAHTVGSALQRRGVAWVADVRDAWTFEPRRPPFPTGIQRRLDGRLERKLLGAADAVVCVSEPAAADLRARGIADPVVITNGWDPEEAAGRAKSSEVGLDPGRASLVYTGRFGSYGRDPKALLGALAAIAAEEEAVAEKLELVVAGPLTGDERPLFERDYSPARVVLAGSLPRERALALQREADALLLIAHPTRSQLLNYKLFEYLAAGRPMLALAEGTEAGRVAAELGATVAPAGDSRAIAAALRRVAAGELRKPATGAVATYAYPAPAAAMARTAELAVARSAS